MKPIEFLGSNCVYAKDQPEYLPLPAHKSPEGIVTCCWKLSWKERFRVLVKGQLWIQLHTFNRPLTPHFPTTKMSDVLRVRIVNDNEHA